MRTRVLILFLCACVLTCPATTLLDPFHQDQSTCNWTGSNVCDVIGTEANYDIQMASLNISNGTATVNLYFNTGAPVTGSGSNMALGSFSDADLSLIVGDLFFYNPDTVYDPSAPANSPDGPDALKYAVVLDTSGRNGLTAGGLYSVTGTETAQQALTATNPGDSAVTSDYYRPDETVLMTSGNLASTGHGLTVANFGNGTTAAEYEVTVSFATTMGFDSLIQNGSIGILFSSADCANDVIQGAVAGVPEPQSLALIAGGLGMLIGVGAWRRRTARK